MFDYDAMYKNVRFDSFENLVDVVNADNRYKTTVTLHYDGTQLHGNVKIIVSPGNSKIREEILLLAAKTLKI